jgi:hypothetical protein
MPARTIITAHYRVRRGTGRIVVKRAIVAAAKDCALPATARSVAQTPQFTRFMSAPPPLARSRFSDQLFGLN